MHHHIRRQVECTPSEVPSAAHARPLVGAQNRRVWATAAGGEDDQLVSLCTWQSPSTCCRRLCWFWWADALLACWFAQVINALTDGKSQHIPYRDSKLTRMLQEVGLQAQRHRALLRTHSSRARGHNRYVAPCVPSDSLSEVMLGLRSSFAALRAGRCCSYGFLTCIRPLLSISLYLSLPSVTLFLALAL